MSVKVTLPSYLQSFTNDKATIEVNGNTVKECLDHLVEQFPAINKKIYDKAGKMHDYASVYVDGEFAYGDELDKPVKDGDELHIVYIIGGG